MLMQRFHREDVSKTEEISLRLDVRRKPFSGLGIRIRLLRRPKLISSVLDTFADPALFRGRNCGRGSAVQ